jgi:hypothetical protein
VSAALVVFDEPGQVRANRGSYAVAVSLGGTADLGLRHGNIIFMKLLDNAPFDEKPRLQQRRTDGRGRIVPVKRHALRAAIPSRTMPSCRSKRSSPSSRA